MLASLKQRLKNYIIIRTKYNYFSIWPPTLYTYIIYLHFLFSKFSAYHNFCLHSVVAVDIVDLKCLCIKWRFFLLLFILEVFPLCSWFWYYIWIFLKMNKELIKEFEKAPWFSLSLFFLNFPRVAFTVCRPCVKVYLCFVNDKQNWILFITAFPTEEICSDQE